MIVNWLDLSLVCRIHRVAEHRSYERLPHSAIENFSSCNTHRGTNSIVASAQSSGAADRVTTASVAH
jgi:hypothetical protein